jgi:RNA polymerase sigma-70 factor (ECF subfamily)
VGRGVDDAELARRLADGDSSALAQVYDRYAASLYRALQAMLSSSVDAEDALQEVFVKLATGRLSRIHDLKSYLFVAARHEAFNILRRRKRERTGDEDDVALQRAQESASGVEVETATCDWTALLVRLPLEQREVIALKVWEQMTFLEIARIVRVSPNTVMSRYRYGIERLRLWCREEERNEL